MTATAHEKVHFPGLNTLRFYAALSVVIVHVSDNFNSAKPYPTNIRWLNALAMDSHMAVNLFFVLSGFLITYLLLRERAERGDIAVWRFYGRRALRIWPLYYLIALTGLVLIPKFVSARFGLPPPPLHQILLVLFFLPNFSDNLLALGHLWSIGLEEQFYLAWPWAARRPDQLPRVILGIVLVKLMVSFVVPFLGSPGARILFLNLRFECMALGALGAYLYFLRHPQLERLYAWPAQAFALAVALWTILFPVPLNTFTNFLSAAAFMVLILNVATNPRSLVKLEHPLLSRLGDMSYGIYMYHYPLLFTLLLEMRRLSWPDAATYNAVLYGVTIAATLLIAAASYYGFERPFLRLKNRLAVVPTQSVDPAQGA